MLTLALAQLSPPGDDPDETLSLIGGLLAEASGQGAQMLVLPELLLPGYNRPDRHRALAQTRDGPWLRSLRAMAREAGCGATLGWAEREGDTLYNTASCIDAQGDVLGHYRKLQLFGSMENAVFTPGDAHTVFDLCGLRTGLLICYDIEFPEQARVMASLGVQLLLVPTANPAGFAHVQRRLIPARAAENGMTVAYANYGGDDHGLQFDGGSIIAGPDGEPLAQAGTAPVMLRVQVAPRDFGLATRASDLRLPRS